MNKLAIVLMIACVATLTPMAFAQDWQPAGDTWIEKWWGLDLVTNTGGFNDSAAVDYLAEGSGGEISNASVSTRDGCRQNGERHCQPAR